MIPSEFQKNYPEVACALTAMFGGSIVAQRDQANEATRKAELQKIVGKGESLHELYCAIWATVQESQARFFESGVTAYHHLGVSDEVRLFMGQLWCSALRVWPVSTQEEFLRRFVDQKGLFLFEALDFAAPIFQHIPLTPEFMLGWITDTRRAVGNDLYQRGLTACLDNYARCQPVSTITMIPLAAAQRHDPQVRGVLARMLHIARDAMPGENALKLAAVEDLLRGPGDAASRALLLESWALAAGTPGLSESHALALRHELCRGASEEEATWCFLLAQVVSTDKPGWTWAHRELSKLTMCTLDAQARYWALIACLNGWAAAADDRNVSRKVWADLFFAFPPLTTNDSGVWRRLECTLRDSLKPHPVPTRDFMVRLASTAGRAWRQLMDGERGLLASWTGDLHTSGQASALITELCLSAVQQARRVGLKLLGATPGATLDATALATALPAQLELLVLQGSLQLGDYANTARLHASLAPAIDRVGGDVAECFYDEVLTQALNTHQYRETLKSAAPNHDKIQATLTEAHCQLDATIAAAKSPALQMQIPGRRRAENLAIRRFSRQVAKSVDQFSIFKQIVTTVPLLYGKVWRMQDAGGNLTRSSALQQSSVSMEMPRLEFVTPDAMRLRRLCAASRISELQRGDAEEEE